MCERVSLQLHRNQSRWCKSSIKYSLGPKAMFGSLESSRRELSNGVGVWGSYPSPNGRKTGVTASKLPESTQTPPIGAMQMQQIMHQTRMHAHAAEIQPPAMRGQPAAIRTRMYMCGTL